MHIAGMPVNLFSDQGPLGLPLSNVGGLRQSTAAGKCWPPHNHLPKRKEAQRTGALGNSPRHSGIPSSLHHSAKSA